MKRRTWLLICLLIAANGIMAQDREAVDSSYANGYYTERVKFFNLLHPPAGGIVFLGNSITEAGPWSEVLPGREVSNRGISGDNSFGVYARLDQVLALRPRKLFLLIGINDLKRGTPPQYILASYERTVAKVKAASPHTVLYLQSVLPVAEQVMAPVYAKISNQKIRVLNEGLRQLAAKYHCTYIDLYNDVFVDEQGQLKRELTTDGLHLKQLAYIKWTDYLKKKKYL